MYIYHKYLNYDNCKFVDRFLSIDQIHNSLKELFPNEDLITYYEGKVFKEMLCIINGEDKGISYFGEIWITTPNSCYSNLIPPDKSTIKIKCENCGTIHKFEDVTNEMDWGGKKLITFLKKREIDEPCCNIYDLVWNIII